MSRKPELKTPEQIELMRVAGLLVADTLAELTRACVPGTTTGALDALAHRTITEAGGIPSFLGYHGFPASTCISVGAEVVHGIPAPDRVLEIGDVVSIDCGAIVDGWHGDAAVTLCVGGRDAVRPEVLAMVDATEEALWAGIAAVRAGNRLGAIGAAIEAVTTAAGLGLLDGYTGHGIGTALHQAPDVENRPGGRDHRLRLAPGHVIAIEPMTTLGSPEVHELADGWTVVTDDGLPGAHWEHTVAVTSDGPWVLTAHDGGHGRLGTPTVADSRLAAPAGAVTAGPRAAG